MVTKQGKSRYAPRSRKKGGKERGKKEGRGEFPGVSPKNQEGSSKKRSSRTLRVCDSQEKKGEGRRLLRGGKKEKAAGAKGRRREKNANLTLKKDSREGAKP